MSDRTYPVIEEVEETYNKLVERNFTYIPTPPNQLIPLGVGNMVGVEELSDLRMQVLSKATLYGFPDAKTGELTTLDKEIGKVIYQNMDITPSVAATTPMWLFINLCLLPDYIYWRFGASKDHFISDRRNYFGTQWWRYYLFCIFDNGESQFFDMTDRNIADLYERTNTCGYPNHVIEEFVWFNQLWHDNLDKVSDIGNKDDLFRSVLKQYGSKLAYRFYLTIPEEEKSKLFSICFQESLELVKKQQKEKVVTPVKKRVIVRIKNE